MLAQLVPFFLVCSLEDEGRKKIHYLFIISWICNIWFDFFFAPNQKMPVTNTWILDAKSGVDRIYGCWWSIYTHKGTSMAANRFEYFDESIRVMHQCRVPKVITNRMNNVCMYINMYTKWFPYLGVHYKISEKKTKLMIFIDIFFFYWFYLIGWPIINFGFIYNYWGFSRRRMRNFFAGSQRCPALAEVKPPPRLKKIIKDI